MRTRSVHAAGSAASQVSTTNVNAAVNAKDFQPSVAAAGYARSRPRSAVDAARRVRRVNVSAPAQTVTKRTAGVAQTAEAHQKTAAVPSNAITARGLSNTALAAQPADSQETSVPAVGSARSPRVCAAESVEGQTAASAAVAVSERKPSVTAVGSVRPSKKIVPASKFLQSRLQTQSYLCQEDLRPRQAPRWQV